jgi:MFS transporter, ACS family, glucarate transporter
VKYQHRVLGLLSLLSVITYLDRVCIAVAGPRMQDSLHIGPQAWGWVTSVFFLSYSAFEIPTGLLGDRSGARRVLTRVVLWWSAFTSLTGAVSRYSILLLVRFCFGMGEAGAYPNASVVIGRWIPVRHRARAWGIVWMTSQIGGAVAPLLVVPVQVLYGWRASFYLFGFLGVIWGGVWYWWYRDSPAEKSGVTQAELEELGDGSPARQHHGLPWGAALSSGNLWRIMAIAACYVYALSFFQSWFQTYLVRGRGYSEVQLVLSALPYMVGACANVLGGITSDRLVRRFGLKAGRRAVGVAGLGAAALFLTATIVTKNNTAALIFLSLVYGGITFQQPNLGAVCLDLSQRHAGAVFGFGNTAGNAASAVSSVVFGYMVGHFGSYSAPLIPMVLSLSVGMVLWLRIDPTKELFAGEHGAGLVSVIEPTIEAT